MSIKDELIASTIEEIYNAGHRDGFKEGIAVAEQISTWLGMNGASKKMLMVKEWADKAIVKARERQPTPPASDG